MNGKIIAAKASSLTTKNRQKAEKGGSVKFTALGGGDSIGGSCYLLEAAGRKIVLDCGVRFRKNGEGKNEIFFPDFRRIRHEKIDLILISHAHLDHLGAAPRLAAQHPEAAIFMTAPTLAIGTLLLEDMLKIRKQEEKKAARRLSPPVFNRRQLDWFFSRINPIVEPGWFSPLPGWEIGFWPAGHIRGAASVLLKTPEGTAMFTGDISAGEQPTVGGARLPEADFRPDVLVTESTYGGRNLPPREAEVDRLVGKILDVKRRGGKVLIPAFAVGRSIDVALDLVGHGIPVYLDGMARGMAEIYHADASWCKLDKPFPLPDLIEEGFVTMVPREKEEGHQCRESWLAGENFGGHDFAVMISPSGTLDGGYARKYAKRIFGEYRSAIFFPGFLMEGTAGRQVTEIERGRAVKVDDEVFNVRCEVERFNLSAHDSADNLAGRVAVLSPRRVVLVHGEPDAQRALRERLAALSPPPEVFEGKAGKIIEL